jgi:hypothetical protein
MEEMLRAMAQIAESHVSGNVPPEAEFMNFLQRDVRAYLIANRRPSRNLEIDLLRKGPTQTGIAYPKYYVWIRAADGPDSVVEGAMQVSAVARVRFLVSNFTLASAIRNDPASLSAVYPAVLIPTIRKRASVD